MEGEENDVRSESLNNEEIKSENVIPDDINSDAPIIKICVEGNFKNLTIPVETNSNLEVPSKNGF